MGNRWDRVPVSPNSLPYMGQPRQQGQPLAALTRWLAELQYNSVRRIETPSLLNTISRTDGRPLRGVLLMTDLVMTRQKTFYRIVDQGSAIPLTNTEVADQYDVAELQEKYKSLQEEWKSAHRVTT
jgi:hypothetical protein